MIGRIPTFWGVLLAVARCFCFRTTWAWCFWFSFFFDVGWFSTWSYMDPVFYTHTRYHIQAAFAVLEKQVIYMPVGDFFFSLV